MARLFEFEGKEQLKKAGIPIPQGLVASTAKEAREAAAKIGKPVAVKAQVWVGGRGKAGGIKLADTPEEAEKHARDILGMEIKGFPVRKVLIEEKIDIAQEYYVGIVPQGAWTSRCPVLIFSTKGGMDIESIPEDDIVRCKIDYLKGFPTYDAVDLASGAGVANELLRPMGDVLSKVVDVFKSCDCSILEINPLVVTKQGKIIASDCRMAVDDSASYRHPEMNIDIPREFPWEPSEFDIVGWGIEETDLRGSGFVMKMTLDETDAGYIGFHAIGGGAAMIGIDALSRVGLKAANFADTSGNPVASKVYRVAKTIFAQTNIQGYLLAGFMISNQEQWHHAHALVRVLREEIPKRPGFPCVLLLAGNKEEESMEILKTGLKGLPGRIEIYGREYVEDSDFIGQRMVALVEEYNKERKG